MAAVILVPHPAPRRPSLRLVDPARSDGRTVSRSVTPPPRVQPSPPTSTFWRRRLMVLLVLTSVVVGAHLLVSAAISGSDERSVVTASSAADASFVAPNSEPIAPAVYVVRPGDTMWSIATRLQPEGDVRQLVDQLTERAGGSGLQAGQRIALDGLGV